MKPLLTRLIGIMGVMVSPAIFLVGCDDRPFSIAELQERAEAGHSDSQFTLGTLYLSGANSELRQNDNEAVKWLTRAADRRNAQAEYLLGTLYLKGQAVPCNTNEALKYIQLAAKNGDPPAQNLLGKCFLNGWGVAKDSMQAAVWFKKAARKGLADAQFRLAERYRNGEGVEQSFKKCGEWLAKSANQGDIEAQWALSVGLDNGEAGKIDYEESYKWALIIGQQHLIKFNAYHLKKTQREKVKLQAKKFQPVLDYDPKSQPDADWLYWILGVIVGIGYVWIYIVAFRTWKMRSRATALKPALSSAFTLIELLVAISIIAILASLLLTGLSRSKIQAIKTYCASNLRQMDLGSQMYAHDDSQGFLTATYKKTSRWQMADDDVNWLYPGYIGNLNSFICPSTQNYIRTNSVILTNASGAAIKVLVDLSDNATNRTAPGTSYEVFGTWHNEKAKYPRKTLKSVLAYAHQNPRSTFYGQIAGPANTWIFLDAAEIHPPTVLHENYPNPIDNHGTEGGNVSFADGHVEWIPVKRYNYRYELSEDQGRTIYPF